MKQNITTEQSCSESKNITGGTKDVYYSCPLVVVIGQRGHDKCIKNQAQEKRFDEKKIKLKKDWMRRSGFNETNYSNVYCGELYCTNCGKVSPILIKKGVKVPKHIKCEYCGCKT